MKLGLMRHRPGRGGGGGGGGVPSGAFDGVSGFTDFSEATVGTGSLPLGWTTPFASRFKLPTLKVLATGDALNDCPLPGNVFYLLNGANSQNWSTYVWDPVPVGTGAYGETLCLIRKHGPAWSNFPCVMNAFALKDNNWVIWGTDNATRSKGYVLGTQTFIVVDPKILANEWHWVRFQRDSAMRVYKGKVWHYADAEPGAWQLDVDRGSDEGQVGGNTGFMIPSVLKDSETGTSGYQVKYFAFTLDPASAPLPLPAAALP
jgi:hypothetical protein